MSEAAPPEDQALKPLGEYAWPEMPTERTIISIAERVKNWFTQEDDEPMVSADQLRRTEGQERDNAPAAPPCAPLEREIGTALDAWASQVDGQSTQFVLVLPPNQHRALLAEWAEHHDHPLLPTPDRSRLLTEVNQPFSLEGEGILVIPELSHWFLRHRHGLTQVTRLLSAVSATRRPCIIGCNSWAWAYLCRAASASQWLPQARTFQAFDQHRLHSWLLSLDQCDTSQPTRYRESRTGDDVFQTDENGKCESDYFESLSALSLGIPWVAWNLWQRSVRTVRDDDAPDDDDKDDDTDQTTLWLVEHKEMVLTEDIRESALFILHALLLHGQLNREQLHHVLPASRSNADMAPVTSKLIENGFIVERQDGLRCTNAAYPAIRRYLEESGFPLDIL